MPIKERIRVVYGSAIANELLEIDGISNDELGLVKVSGVMTNANYNNKKKIQPIIFINHRLVTCEPLKRAINAVFLYFLPREVIPFIILVWN